MSLGWVVLDLDLNKRATCQIFVHHVQRHDAKSETRAQEMMLGR
jgi:hypothetical protein